MKVKTHPCYWGPRSRVTADPWSLLPSLWAAFPWTIRPPVLFFLPNGRGVLFSIPTQAQSTHLSCSTMILSFSETYDIFSSLFLFQGPLSAPLPSTQGQPHLLSSETCLFSIFLGQSSWPLNKICSHAALRREAWEVGGENMKSETPSNTSSKLRVMWKARDFITILYSFLNSDGWQGHRFLFSHWSTIPILPPSPTAVFDYRWVYTENFRINKNL